MKIYYVEIEEYTNTKCSIKIGSITMECKYYFYFYIAYQANIF